MAVWQYISYRECEWTTFGCDGQYGQVTSHKVYWLISQGSLTWSRLLWWHIICLQLCARISEFAFRLGECTTNDLVFTVYRIPYTLQMYRKIHTLRTWSPVYTSWRVRNNKEVLCINIFLYLCLVGILYVICVCFPLGCDWYDTSCSCII